MIYRARFGEIGSTWVVPQVGPKTVRPIVLLGHSGITPHPTGRYNHLYGRLGYIFPNMVSPTVTEVATAASSPY